MVNYSMKRKTLLRQSNLSSNQLAIPATSLNAPPLPKDLPREQVIHDIEDKSCVCCGGELHKIGQDVP